MECQPLTLILSGNSQGFKGRMLLRQQKRNARNPMPHIYRRMLIKREMGGHKEPGGKRLYCIQVIGVFRSGSRIHLIVLILGKLRLECCYLTVCVQKKQKALLAKILFLLHQSQSYPPCILPPPLPSRINFLCFFSLSLISFLVAVFQSLFRD